MPAHGAKKLDTISSRMLELWPIADMIFLTVSCTLEALSTARGRGRGRKRAMLTPAPMMERLAVRLIGPDKCNYTHFQSSSCL